ncbi:MAG TPA: 4-hydroxythreonine-4-phosphate dehydrogenase PdxA [Burkholderiales bacterium]|nr:4-hydroxythreonine-4-phosphate dehydrogenase PdxA [Burkholderiales bacterium]
MGDPGGIGPEIAVKAALDRRVRAICEPVVVGARDVLGLYSKKIRMVETERREFHVGEIHAEHGLAALDAARAAIRGAMSGEYRAVVAAPHSETAIHAAGIEFDGYPSFVARTTGLAPEDGILMLCFEHGGREVRIAHVTLHTSVRQALAMITPERVLRTLRAVRDALGKMGVEQPRIAVSGINPHAGEGGLFGDDETRSVMPAIDAARREGIAADGPIGADILIQRAGYDAYVVMLHDQGHVAAKLLAPQRVAGLTIGTPVLFSSVAHGAAFDIAGQNRANPAAMVEAITRLVAHRRRSSATRKNFPKQ